MGNTKIRVAEDDFMYELVKDLYWQNSTVGAVLGPLEQFLESLKKYDLPEEVLKLGDMVCESVEKQIKGYSENITEKVVNRWNGLGNPISSEEKEKRKSEEDRLSYLKDEYYHD